MSEMTTLTTIDDPKFLKQYMRFCRKITMSMELSVEDGRLWTKFLDSTHVTMTEFAIPVQGPDFKPILLDTDKIEPVIRSLKGLVGFCVENEYLVIESEGKRQKIRYTEVEEPTRQPDPKIENMVEFGIDQKELTCILADVQAIDSNYVGFALKGSKLVYSAKSDTGEIRAWKMVDGYSVEETTGHFSIEWMKLLKILKGQNPIVKFATDRPMCLTYGNPSEPGLKFWIAPRVES